MCIEIMSVDGTIDNFFENYIEIIVTLFNWKMIVSKKWLGNEEKITEISFVRNTICVLLHVAFFQLTTKDCEHKQTQNLDMSILKIAN